MLRRDPPQGLLPSLLDRLLDPESGGTAWQPGYGVEQMMSAVQRDLEDLLNTHQSCMGLPEEFTEASRSLVAYGLPDLCSLNAVSRHQREEIGRLLEGVIARFEPRLREVRTTLVDRGDSHDRTMRFRVEARLAVEPAPPVAFETVLELMTGRCCVQPGGT